MQKRQTLLPFILLYLAVLAVIIAVNTNIRLNDLSPIDISVERIIKADGIIFNLLWDLKTLYYTLAEALLALLFVGMIRHLCLKRKINLIIKLLTISVPVIAAGCFLLIQIPDWDMRYFLLISICVFIAVLLVFIFMAAVSLCNLNRLKRCILAFSDGDYSIRAPVRSKDEIGELSAAFNGMADSVEHSMESIKAVGAAYGRFVPNEMLSMLSQDSITDINTTDYASLRAMFMLLTTESFDSYQEEAYLDAVNDFYTCILPVLSRGSGLVERFTANELRALFDREPLAVLNTVLEMFAALNRLNTEFENSGQKPIECGVLLAFSESFLGIAGYSKRLNIILQSRYSYKVDSVRVIGTRYGCRLLLEQTAFEGLGTAVLRYRHRLLGYILDGGERRTLYDFYDGEPVEQVRFKDITRERFNEAVKLYYAAKYDKSRSMFIDIIQQTPNDLAAREYLKKSHLRFDSDAPPDYLFEV